MCPMSLLSDSEDPDQTARPRSLIRAFAVRTCSEGIFSLSRPHLIICMDPRTKGVIRRTPDYTLCSGVHVCWSEHSDSSFVYGFMSLDYGFGTMTTTTFLAELPGG